MTDDLQENKEASFWFGLFIIIAMSMIVLHFVLRLFLDLYWIDRQANIQIQNPNNIKQSCLYFAGYRNTKHGKLKAYSVDSITFSYANHTIGSFKGKAPFTAEKARQFYDDVDKYQQSKCYKVAYIHLDYWIVKKTYLYDYFGVE